MDGKRMGELELDMSRLAELMRKVSKELPDIVAGDEHSFAAQVEEVLRDSDILVDADGG